MNDKDFASADVMVLGALLMHADEDSVRYAMNCVEKYGVKADWFRNGRHAKLFDAIMKSWCEHHSLDPFHINKNYVDDDGVDFPGLYDELSESGAMLAHLDYYLIALKQKAIYGKVHKMTAEWLTEMRPDNIGIQIEDFAKKLHDFQETLADNDSGLRKIGDYLVRSVEKKRKLHEERFVKHNWAFMDGLPWPWHCMNQIFTGLKKGIHVVAALASQGKSTMAANLSVFWNERGIKHGIISIDMAGDQLVDRLPCIMERVSLAKLNFGASADDVAKFERGFKRAAESDNVWISEEDGAKTIEYQCYRGVKTFGWQAVIIDYIQLVSPDEKGQMPEYTRVQRAVQAVKRIAKRLKIPIICLAQLSRQFEKEYNLFYDAGDFFRSQLPDGDYQLWKQALDEAVVEKRFAEQWRTCMTWRYIYSDFEMTEEKYHGVSMYIPQDPNTEYGKYYARNNEDIKQLKWYQSVGW